MSAHTDIGPSGASQSGGGASGSRPGPEASRPVRVGSPARLWRLQRAVLRRVRARSFTWLATLAIVLSVCTALLHVSVRLRVIRVGYALSQETQLRHTLSEQNQRLRLELAARKDPATVERIARERLKMGPPDPGSIRILQLKSEGPTP